MSRSGRAHPRSVDTSAARRLRSRAHRRDPVSQRADGFGRAAWAGARAPRNTSAPGGFRRHSFDLDLTMSISEEQTTLLALTGRGRTPGSSPGLRRAAVACGVAALGSSAVVAVAAGGASAAAGCQATYSITSQWNVGFGVSVSVTNLGAPISSWTVGWTFPGNQQITQLWNGSYTQSGANVSVANA